MKYIRIGGCRARVVLEEEWKFVVRRYGMGILDCNKSRIQVGVKRSFSYLFKGACIGYQFLLEASSIGMVRVPTLFLKVGRWLSLGFGRWRCKLPLNGCVFDLLLPLKVRWWCACLPLERRLCARICISKKSSICKRCWIKIIIYVFIVRSF